jgi:hypothetical protein
MPELLEQGGQVDLWGGWAIRLPSSYYQRNEDASWSAWGADWTVDITIIEIAGDADGAPVPPKEMLGVERVINASGTGWVGMTEVVTEFDQGRSVFRLAGTLAAANSMMSCWVSYHTVQQRPFAEDLIRGVDHAPTATS